MRFITMTILTAGLLAFGLLAAVGPYADDAELEEIRRVVSAV